jgi:hypothetical protein
MGECFPGLQLDEPQDLEDSVVTAVYKNQSLDFLMRLAKPQVSMAAAPGGAGAEQGLDASAVKAELQAAGVTLVTFRASGLKMISLSSAALSGPMKQGACQDQITNQGHYVVSDALGATTFDYDLADSSGRSLTASIPVKVIQSLFRLGLSGSAERITSSRFSKTTFIGFGLLRWNRGKNSFEIEKVGSVK